jgi:hypothetical protein
MSLEKAAARSPSRFGEAAKPGHGSTRVFRDFEMDLANKQIRALIVELFAVKEASLAGLAQR